MIPRCSISAIFFFNDTATTEIYTLSLHDALPICRCTRRRYRRWARRSACGPHPGSSHRTSRRGCRSDRHRAWPWAPLQLRLTRPSHDDLVDETILDRLLPGEEEVAIGILLDLLETLAGVLDEDVVHLFA